MRCYQILVIALLAALLFVVPSARASVTPPPDAPSWWENPPGDAIWWAFANSLGEVNTNNPDFSILEESTEIIEPLDLVAARRGRHFSFTFQNGYRAENTKRFYVLVVGTGAADPPTYADAPVAGDNAPDHPPSQIVPPDGGWVARNENGNWSVLVQGVAAPQPRKLRLNFDVIGTSTTENTIQRTTYWIGDYCFPEPSTLGLLLTGLLLARRR